jgi:FkbM family methyltransferase
MRGPHPHSTASYAQEGEDLVLARLLDAGTQGFYVDVGAHHPTRFSNTCFYYERGWRGINIEPAPDAVAQFDKVRPRDINLGLGVAEAAGELTYYVFDEAALNTFDQKLKEERETSTSYRVVRTTKIRVDRLDRILQQHLPAGQAIDFMSIDVEGLDLQVLRSNDWKAHRPKFVLAEALDFNLEQAANHPLWIYMHSVQYELVAKTLNTLFYRDAE